VGPEQSPYLDSKIHRPKQVTTFPRKGKTMQARFRIPVSSMLLISLALLGRPEKGYAQVTDYNNWTSGSTAEIQQIYVNFALQSSTGMNFSTGNWPDVGPTGTAGLKRAMVLLSGRYTASNPQRWTCIELTTSVATTGYPSTHVWFENWNAGWQSISTGLTNFVRAYVDAETNSPASPLYVYAGSSSTNNKDFNIVLKRVITPNHTSSECQVAGKPFIDYTQEDASGKYFTANTN
jgi:hypothetical protein